MSRDPQELPRSADPLGETLHLLRLTGMLYCRAELRAPWGIELPSFDDCMMLHIVTAGTCLLEVDGRPPVTLTQGSLALLPHGKGHFLRSDAKSEAAPLFDIPVEKVSERYEVMRHGGNGKEGALTQTICVVVRFDHIAALHLTAQLPQVIFVDTWSEDEDNWLQSTLRFIAQEAKELRPGGETVITRLADILVIQMIRSWIDSASEPEQGWLAALRDESLGRALASIYREPGRDWTVESLASEACMSRSAFSQRFTELVGETVMRYLAGWRMQLARGQLRDSSEPISVLSDRLGYRSEAAFSRAFKRMFGVTPGSMRKPQGPAPS